MSTKPKFGLKGLKERGGRVKFSLTSKFSKTEETIDVAFNQEEQRFQDSYKALKIIQKDLQHYFSLLRDIGIHHAVITDSFSKLYENHQKMWNTSQKNSAIQMEIDNHRTALENQMNDDAFLPLSEYMGQFKIIDDRIKERGRRRVDMDRYRTEVKRLTEKPPNDPNKLPAAQKKYNCSRKGYEDLNKELVTDMNRLHVDRLEFVDPLFATFVTVQASYHALCAQKFAELAQLVGHIDRSEIHKHPTVISERSAADMNPYDVSGEYPSEYSAPASSSHNTGHSGSSASSFNTTPAPSTYVTTTTTTMTSKPVTPRGNLPAPVQRKPQVVAQAMYPFQAQSPVELSFQYGDMITILAQEGDWWQGELNGKQGLVPSNYVQIARN